jgi:FkbM family methyltransferase
MLIDPKSLMRRIKFEPNGVLHIGAHTGEEIDRYQNLTKGPVIWVEAQGELCEVLKKRIPSNHKVINATVFSENGIKKHFLITNNSQSSSLLALGTHKIDNPEVAVVKTLEVVTTRLDSLISLEEMPNFLNLDIQGTKLDAIKGLGFLINQVNCIYTEVNRKFVYENCTLVGELDLYLKNYGFSRVSTRWIFGKGWGDAVYFRDDEHSPPTEFKVTEYLYHFVHNVKETRRFLVSKVLGKVRSLKHIDIPRKNSLVVLLKGGLGNQLFQLARAAESDYETIELDWCICRPRIEQNGLPALFEYRLPGRFSYTPIRNLKSRILKPTILARKTAEDIFSAGSSKKFKLGIISKFSLLTYFRTVPIIIRENDCNIKNKAILIGYFQNIISPSKPKVRNFLRALELKSYSNEVIEYRELASIERPPVIHIRLGDYRENKDFGILGSTYYKEASARLKQEGDYIRIWLFSDEPSEAIKILPREFHDQVRIIPILPIPAAQTLEIMRLGSAYIIGNSSFSWWGAYLRYDENSVVAAPNPRVHNIGLSGNIYPPEWILVNSSFQ